MSVRDDFTSLRISAATGAEREWRAHIARSSVRPAPTGRHSRLQGYGSQGLTSGALFYKRFDQPAFAFNAGVYIRLPTPPGFRRATFLSEIPCSCGTLPTSDPCSASVCSKPESAQAPSTSSDALHTLSSSFAATRLSESSGSAKTNASS